jgi:hypothetical protein
MNLTRWGALVFAGLIVMACGAAPPGAQISQAPSPTPTQQSEPTPNPTPTPTPTEPPPTPAVASVKCSGGPGAVMVVIAGQFVYDVASVVHPRLICRGANTDIRLLGANDIAYSKVVSGHVVIVKRNLTTGAESAVAQLRADPQTYLYGPSWASNGSLEVYATYGSTAANGRKAVLVHLWANGADHVLYTTDTPTVGGAEGRWGDRPIVKFSPDHRYVAISDSAFAMYGSKVRIFSVADHRQRFVTESSASGGTWISNDRFVWASRLLMQWTPAGGATVLRSESWFVPSTSSDWRWLAGTLLTDPSKPHVRMVSVGGSRVFLTRGLASSPGFVTPTVVWYAEERPVAGGGVVATWPDGNVHAFDLRNATDQLVVFRTGEKPMIPNGNTLCCSTEG